MRILIVLGVPIDLTGSGVVVKNLIKELDAAGHSVMLLTAHFKRMSNAGLGLPDGVTVKTVLFSDVVNTEESGGGSGGAGGGNGDGDGWAGGRAGGGSNGDGDGWAGGGGSDGEGVGEDRCEVSFPIPVFSSGFKFPNIRFLDMTRDQIDEYMNVFSDRLATIISEFKPDVIHTHHLFLLNAIVRRVAPHMPLVCTCHGTEIKMLEEDGSLLPFVAPGVRAVDRIIAVSEDIKRKAARMFGFDTDISGSDKITVVGNGYDAGVFYPKNVDRGALLREFGIYGEYKKTVLFVGKFAEWKGVEYLIRASKHFSLNADGSRNLTLIAGDGDAARRESYIRMINAYGLGETVKVATPPDNRPDIIADLMASSDVFALPSVSEPFGNVLLEALGCGTPAAYANTGGPPGFVPAALVADGFAAPTKPLEKLQNGAEEGAENDADERYANRIADAVNGLLARNRSFDDRRKIAQSVSGMTWAAVCEKTLECYHTAIRHIVSFGSPDADIKALVGSKACGVNFLMRMQTDRYQVPGGFILTTNAFKKFIYDNKMYNACDIKKISDKDAADGVAGDVNDAGLLSYIYSAPMPDAVEDALRARLSEHAGVKIARSSSMAEDGEGESCSGRFASVCGLRGYDETAAGIRDVWASASRYAHETTVGAKPDIDFGVMTRMDIGAKPDIDFGVKPDIDFGVMPHMVIGAKPDTDFGVKPHMAVIIQDYIESTASGVAHSVNTENGLPEIVIECSRCAQDVTDARATPDKWRFILYGGAPVFFERIVQPKNVKTTGDCGRDRISQRLYKPAMTDRQAGAVAQMCAELFCAYEAETGVKNIDVEFCFGIDGALYALQIRPLNGVRSNGINPVCLGVAAAGSPRPVVMLDGAIANPGVAKGRLVVIDAPGFGTETDYFLLARDVVKQGDIVVTPTVNLSWTILLDKIAGLVTQRGGATSHSANLTRERGVPCIVGAENACSDLVKYNGELITLDAYNGAVYGMDMPLAHKPLNDLIWRSGRGARRHEAKEPSHWTDESGKEWAKKPVCPLGPLQYQLYHDAWKEANASFPERKVPIIIKNAILYAGLDELVALGDYIKCGAAGGPYAFFEDRVKTVQKMKTTVESFEPGFATFKEFFDVYTHMIMHFHLRAEFRRRAALVLREEALNKIPCGVANVASYLINRNAPAEITETRRFDTDYRDLLYSIDDSERSFMIENRGNCDFSILTERFPGLAEKITNFLMDYKISRRQSDNWDESLPYAEMIEKLRRDIAGESSAEGVVEAAAERVATTAPEDAGAYMSKPQVLRTVEGFKAFLYSLKPHLTERGAIADYDSFVNAIAMSEEQAIAVENERHWQHRWQQKFRKQLLGYGTILTQAGLISQPEDILCKNKDEILQLAYEIDG